MSIQLSFEESVLSSHDWVQNTQVPAAAKVVQDDYDSGVQELYITYSNGTRKYQRRQWEGQSHDDFLRLDETNATNSESERAGIRLAFIEKNSTLIEERDLDPVGDTNYEPQPQNDEDTIEVLEVSLEELQLLSMELRSEVYQNLTKGLGVFQSLSSRFKAFLDRRAVQKDMDFDLSAFERFIAKVGAQNYADLLDVRCFTPPGTRCTYLELLETLRDCQKFADETLNETILPLKQWVSFCHNDPAKLKSIRTSTPVKFIDPTKLSKQLSARCAFTGVAQRAFGDCFAQNSELGKVEELVRDLMSEYTATSIDRFDTETKALSSAMVALSDLVGRLGDDKVSAEIADKLADCCYKAARQVEFYAVYQTVLRATLSALSQTQQHWSKHVLR